MRFTVSAAALLAFVANALAQNPDFDPVTKPLSNEKVNAGSTYTIEWTAPEKFKDVTISISLIGGATQGTQIPLLDIASGIPNSAGKYSWTIPSTLGKDAIYGLKLASEANPDVDWQWSNPFHIVAAEGASSGTTTVTSSVGTATVTLSSASATAAATKTAATSEVVVVNSTTALSTTVAPTAVSVSSAPATVITSVTKPASNGTATKTASTTIATVTNAAGGAQATAGVFAVLGGLAVAALL
ncbi:hypothetical protein CMUS01_03457 [Colletotrichum musicola]|uniref:Yeast cell wall synthesis Kre9/Knh1-like N-terminal domain-containing protein n=3 Tax=Colletotrichum orchidearum species complex TaxID=2707337 RepID=A0A8H6NSR3_9PEZI|nr:hypothetical protein CSOJ01_12600 [Colletotrichum sojae]KAF6837645.1 hypothetical protein CPLU01_02998 [Colletotrichum plurivorum]KAF6841788.1 hypothetical protein CMUS01_03457 [Colletotrichum musicola]